MRHYASPQFWTAYEALPLPVRKLADANFEFLKRDPRHPSLQFKKVGRYWSVRLLKLNKTPSTSLRATRSNPPFCALLHGSLRRIRLRSKAGFGGQERSSQ